MANPDHVLRLRDDPGAWNSWRATNPRLLPDLSGAKLAGLTMPFGSDLSRVDLRGADLQSSQLEGANLRSASLQEANLQMANLRKAELESAILDGADLTGANLHRANLSEASLRGARLVECQLDVARMYRANLDRAVIVDSYVETNPIKAHYSHAGLLAVIEADGLDRLNIQSAPFLERFVKDAFDVAHWGARYVNEEALQRALARIKPLATLSNRTGVFSDELIEVIGAVDAGLIQFLQRNPKQLHEIHWRAFEELIAELLKGFGWSVQLTEPTKDGGYDLLGIHKDVSGVSSAWVIECKRWEASRKVGIEIARSLYTIKNEMRVSGAMLATTSDFTAGVKRFKASRYDFELINYEAIVEWLNAYCAS